MWSEPPQKLTLQRGEAHVWRVQLDQPPEVVEGFWRTLAEDERARAGRFHFEKHRWNFIVGRGVLRLLLGRYLETAPEEIRFSYGAQGKPALSGEYEAGPLRFNASHSGELAVYAFVNDSEIGVDVELIKGDFATEEIAERFFSASEIEALSALPAPERPAGFFRCWTRKEAYIKAIGSGLSHPLDQFDVTLAPDEPAALLRIRQDPESLARWSLFDLDVGLGYAAAMAVAGPVNVLRRWTIAPA